MILCVVEVAPDPLAVLGLVREHNVGSGGTGHGRLCCPRGFATNRSQLEGEGVRAVGPAQVRVLGPELSARNVVRAGGFAPRTFTDCRDNKTYLGNVTMPDADGVFHVTELLS